MIFGAGIMIAIGLFALADAIKDVAKAIRSTR